MVETFIEQLTPQRLAGMRTSLERWYAQHGRDLPWRQTSDPYRIWISEIMLQQTTVKAVIPYFERFLQRFPTVQDLAAADEADVLKLWEGLGYYSRGRNLRLAAIRVCQDHGGEFPSDLSALQRLPGIGRYTAGAIRSFGFNLPAPIVEANTLRLYCRLLGYEGDPRGKEGQDLLWEFATRIQPKKEAGHLNQALMEVGGQICTPVNPRCPECPLIRSCRAYEEGLQARIPAPKSRPEVTQLVEGTLAVRSGMLWLVRQRSEDERWAGMWDFPRFPVTTVSYSQRLTKLQAHEVSQEIALQLQEQTGVRPGDLQEVLQIRHSVTRYRIRLICVAGSLVGALPKLRDERFQWKSLDELAVLPMPVTGRQFATHLRQLDEGQQRDGEGN
jgi:A/G-specific adenine glycosylase